MENGAEKPRSANDLFAWGTRVLEAACLHYGHGTQTAEDEAIQLVLHAAGLGYDADDAALRRELPRAARDRAVELVRRRVRERKPAPYLTGVAHYGGLQFEVNESVLIPRSSILELIEQHFQPWLGAREPQRILDLCTGSGCLAILCALAFPASQVDASDISEAAIEVAKRNIARHSLTGRVTVIRSDVFDALGERRYDLIVSNPPYVGADEMAALPEEYRHEPALALEAAEQGLAIVRRILEQAPRHLTEPGLLVVEVGNSEQAVLERWPELPLAWIDFERSEGGVFIIGAQELREWNQSHSLSLSGRGQG